MAFINKISNKKIYSPVLTYIKVAIYILSLSYNIMKLINPEGYYKFSKRPNNILL